MADISKQSFDKALHDKGWKGPLTIGIIALILYAVLHVFGILVMGLIQLILIVAGIVLLCIAGYRGFEASK